MRSPDERLTSWSWRPATPKCLTEGVAPKLKAPRSTQFIHRVVDFPIAAVVIEEHDPLRGKIREPRFTVFDYGVIAVPAIDEQKVDGLIPADSRFDGSLHDRSDDIFNTDSRDMRPKQIKRRQRSDAKRLCLLTVSGVRIDRDESLAPEGAKHQRQKRCATSQITPDLDDSGRA